MSTFTIVVAKYKEDTSWSDGMDNCKIYNKGPDGDIPNVGREGETFLRYIIDHYENLPDYIVILQGDPFGHMSPNITRDNIKDILKNKKFENPNWRIENCFGIWFSEKSFMYPGLNISDYYNFYFNKELEDDIIHYVAGCQYFIRKQAILDNPKDLYIKLRESLIKGSEMYDYNKAHNGPNEFDNSAISPWSLERLWYHFFK